MITLSRLPFIKCCCSGFHPRIFKLIMFCVSSAKMSLLCNWEMLEHFVPQRGLRQGDPLSPYLFVLCIEVLGHQIKESVSKGRWRGVKLSQSSIAISHMFFADDLILFGEASIAQAKTMASIMEDFRHDSGQRVNT